MGMYCVVGDMKRELRLLVHTRDRGSVIVTSANTLTFARAFLILGCSAICTGLILLFIY